ncbi:MAG: hypothetical protein A2W95_11150 [Bacteroidetes bacterium GWA2_40_14]|jgi:hypothetical protein|nr:MAG: hypothetical protein A2W95_11150 [Bacteroidetes bacterium GWA2_40_14]
MKLKIKENHAGVMTLNDGIKANYGTIRVTQNMSKLIYYTGKGLREIFKPDMAVDEKHKAEELKKLDEKILMKSGHIAEILLSEIKELN